MGGNAGESYHAVSLSGGKDSTAMLLLMIERDMPIDVVLTADMYVPVILSNTCFSSRRRKRKL